jgi:hypothetical protein
MAAVYSNRPETDNALLEKNTQKLGLGRALRHVELEEPGDELTTILSRAAPKLQ